jgi:signal transduction histidine kinase
MTRAFLLRTLPALCAILALGSTLTAGAAVLLTQPATERIEASRSQLAALYEVDSAASRYGRQAVDQLLFGYDRSGPLQEARNEMERALANLTRTTREQMHALAGAAELQNELPEIEQTRRIIDIYHAIDASATNAFRISETGDAAAARDALQHPVDFRLGNELRPLLAASIADETRETQAQVAALEDWRTTALGAGAIGTLVSLALSVWLFGRHEREVGVRLAAEREEARQTRERLLSLDEARAKLLADVGHQLRTPLTVLRGEADVALRGHLAAEEVTGALTRIRTQATELGNLLGGFIAAARQSGDIPAITRSPTRIDDVVGAAANEAAVLLDSREIEMTLDLGAAAEVEGDFAYLKQAVMIGLDNAIKHSPPGGRIELSTAAKGGQVVIRVADQGPGVSDADRPHVFERFYRGAQEDELLNPGFGIGLSIAKEIADQHKGSVSLENRPEGGAVLTIRLPAASEGP